MSSTALTPIKICTRALLFLCFLVLHTSSTPVISIPLSSVSDLLIQSALDSLNDNSPTHHTYKSGNLISAQKLLGAPYVIYRLTLNLEANCNEEETSCPREACAIDLRQHEQGVIDVEKSSIVCMYLRPQSPQDQLLQHVEENAEEKTEKSSIQRETTVKKQNNEETLQLDHEVETVVKNGSDRPFIAVRATDRNYCAGCPYELNPTLPGLAAFGEQVVRKMDDSGRSDFKHKVVSIVRVTRAVPPGSNVVRYELNLEIGETNCPRNTMIQRSECTLLTNVPIKLCLVTFEERPWQENSRKITGNNCTDLPDSDNELNGNYEPVGESLTTSLSWAENGESSPSLASSIDTFFEGTTMTATETASLLQQTGNPITEDTITKVVLSTENNGEDEQRTTRFSDKIKEFDAFLEDFDIPIRNKTPEPDNRGGAVPVNEELIRPEVVQRTSTPISQDGEFSAVQQKQQQPNCRNRRSLVDTPKEEKELVRKLAQKAIDVLDDIDVDNNKRIVLGVLDSRKEEIHDGIIFHVTMKVAPTDCDEKLARQCIKSIGEPTKICKVQIHTDKKSTLSSAKVLQLQCFLEEEKREIIRVRRQDLDGAPTSKNVDDPEIKAYAEKGLIKFSEISDSKNEPILVEILQATAQVVAGMLYKIKVRLGESTCQKGVKENCQLKEASNVNDYLITVWSQPWIDKGNPDIKIELQSGNDQVATRVRRSGRRLGGATDKSPNDPDIREYAEKGLRKFSETSDSANEPFLVEILEASAQVVSGMLYKIKVRLGESTCPKGSKRNEGNCQLKRENGVKDYLITVWSQPWIDHGNPDIKIEQQQQKKERHRRESPTATVGQPTLLSPNDPEIQAYAQRGVGTFSSSFDGPYQHLLTEVTEASVQIVSGKLYKIKVKLGESNCPKGTTEGCQLKSDGEIKDCLMTVWSRPWLDNGNADVKVECTPLSSLNRNKRSLRGVNYNAKMLHLSRDIKHEKDFQHFISKYEKVYTSEEEKKARFEIFKRNMRLVEKLRENEQGTAIYGASIFADITPEEFRAKHLGLKPQLRSENQIPFPHAEIPNITLPEEFDWRHYNVVTEVKDQGACGSCWAFSVTGNVEGLYAIKSGRLVSLSEQELVDCDTLDQGCQGGLPDNAYRAIETLGGLELEKDYPYDADDEKCKFDKSKARVNILSGLNITTNETGMAQWLVKNGPISIGINANAMQFYMGGVSHPFKFLCDPHNLDHGVLIVGYGVHEYPIFKKKMPYWTIKNSWGPRWGEQGYYRVYRGDGTCGLNTMATSAVLG